MKKKIIFIFALLFINIFVVQAKEYNCQYYLKEGIGTGWWDVDKTHNFRYTVDTEKKTIRSDKVDTNETADKDWESGEFNAIADTVINPSADEKHYVNKLDGKCQSTIYVCKYTSGVNTRYTLLFNDTYQNDLRNIEPSFLSIKNSNNWYKMYENYTECEKENPTKKNPDGSKAVDSPDCSFGYDFGLCERFYYYDGSGDNDYPDKGEPVDITYSCNKVSNGKDGLLDVVIEKTTDYYTCKSKNKNCSKIANEYNEKLEELKSYCKSVIKYQNYGDSCMTDCLGLQDTLAEINPKNPDNPGKPQGLIDDLNNNRECFLTESIVSMVYNVLKWAKYIAPVLVIILSILDFIKAIAAQNDDDMKKAQGKFVKRLIVAALLFLLPLIINFMLKTFGVYNSKCDISNLFS